MSKIIYKYRLLKDMPRVNEIYVRKGSKPLYASFDCNNDLCIWFECDLGSKGEEKVKVLTGWTGIPMPIGAATNFKYI